MTDKQMFLSLTGNGVPKGELKKKMFEYHNSKVGKSVYARKEENPNTFCGSCIQRVKAAVWKIYHSGDHGRTYKELVFRDRLGIHNQPMYRLVENVKKK